MARTTKESPLITMFRDVFTDLPSLLSTLVAFRANPLAGFMSLFSLADTATTTEHNEAVQQLMEGTIIPGWEQSARQLGAVQGSFTPYQVGGQTFGGPLWPVSKEAHPEAEAVAGRLGEGEGRVLPNRAPTAISPVNLEDYYTTGGQTAEAMTQAMQTLGLLTSGGEVNREAFNQPLVDITGVLNKLEQGREYSLGEISGGQAGALRNLEAAQEAVRGALHPLAEGALLKGVDLPNADLSDVLRARETGIASQAARNVQAAREEVAARAGTYGGLEQTGRMRDLAEYAQRREAGEQAAIAQGEVRAEEAARENYRAQLQANAAQAEAQINAQIAQTLAGLESGLGSQAAETWRLGGAQRASTRGQYDVTAANTQLAMEQLNQLIGQSNLQNMLGATSLMGSMAAMPSADKLAALETAMNEEARQQGLGLGTASAGLQVPAGITAAYSPQLIPTMMLLTGLLPFLGSSLFGAGEYGGGGSPMFSMDIGSTLQGVSNIMNAGRS